MSDTGISPFIFFNHSTSIKMCFLNSWKQIVKTIVRLDASSCLLSFRLGEIIGLIHALEKRFYQYKTQLRYKFGSVYKRCFVCLFVLRLNVPVNNFSVMSGRSHRFLGN